MTCIRHEVPVERSNGSSARPGLSTGRTGAARRCGRSGGADAVDVAPPWVRGGAMRTAEGAMRTAEGGRRARRLAKPYAQTGRGRTRRANTRQSGLSKGRLDFTTDLGA